MNLFQDYRTRRCRQAWDAQVLTTRAHIWRAHETSAPRGFGDVTLRASLLLGLMTRALCLRYAEWRIVDRIREVRDPSTFSCISVPYCSACWHSTCRLWVVDRSREVR
jgi:hypothetical protein